MYTCTVKILYTRLLHLYMRKQICVCVISSLMHILLYEYAKVRILHAKTVVRSLEDDKEIEMLPSCTNL